MNIVRQRYATDCGVAALATALQVEYEIACNLLCETKTNNSFGNQPFHSPDKAYWGVSERHMCDAVTATASGAPLAQASGSRGVLLVTRGCDDEWQDGTGKHWLAWWREANGRVTVYNPSNGETFDSQNLHVRGYRMVCHISVA